MQTKTIKIRKKYVFGFFFFVIAAITIFMLINAFTEMNKAAPDPVENYDNIELIQFEPVGDGAQVALISTDVGDMKAVLYPDEDKEYLSAEEGEMPEVRHAFYEHGGVPNYAGQYAVFGQVFEGIDVLEKIADSEMGTEIAVKSVEILTDSE